MSETDMRKNLCNDLRALDAQAMENRVGPGTPDVAFIGGWIECKWLRAWPKRPTTVVTLDHPITKSQKVWIRRHVRRGGRAWVLLQCRREWLLFAGDVACDFLGSLTRAELYRRAYHVWRKGLDADELIAIVQSRCKRKDVFYNLSADEREARWKALGGSW
jgi:hypothetical protein